MGIRPLFSSAPRCKIYISGITVAYAIGFNFNLSVEVQPVMTIGSYGPVSLEPTMYNTVTGTIQIVRLRENSTEFTNSLSQGNLFRHLDPGQILLTESFEIKVFRRGLTKAGQSYVESSVSTVEDVTTATLTTKEATADSSTVNEHLWLQIQDCRITSSNTNISMGQLVNQPVNFQGLMATAKIGDEDTGGFLKDDFATQGL